MFSIFDQKEIGDNSRSPIESMNVEVVVRKIKNVQLTLDVLQGVLIVLPKTDNVAEEVALAWSELEDIIDYLEFKDE